jgi:hypothetical protein
MKALSEQWFKADNGAHSQDSRKKFPEALKQGIFIEFILGCVHAFKPITCIHKGLLPCFKGR